MITTLSHHVHKLTNPDFLMQLILDVSVILNVDKIYSVELGLLELNTREYIHRMDTCETCCGTEKDLKYLVTVYKVNSECKYVRAHANTTIPQPKLSIKPQNSHKLSH